MNRKLNDPSPTKPKCNTYPKFNSHLETNKIQAKDTKHNILPENNLLNLDDTLLQNVNIDEIVKKANDFQCQNTNMLSTRGTGKRSKWVNLSLNKTSLTDSQNLHRKTTRPPKLKEYNIVKCDKLMNQSERNEKAISEDIKKLQMYIENDMLLKQSTEPVQNKIDEHDYLVNGVNTTRNRCALSVNQNKEFTSTNEETDFFKMISIDMISEEQNTKNDFNLFPINCHNFGGDTSNSDTKNSDSNKIHIDLQSPCLFSSEDSNALFHKTNNRQTSDNTLKISNENHDSSDILVTHNSYKKVSQVTPDEFQTDFSQLVKCSQVIKQLDNAILQDISVTHNSFEKVSQVVSDAFQTDFSQLVKSSQVIKQLDNAILQESRISKEFHETHSNNKISSTITHQTFDKNPLCSYKTSEQNSKVSPNDGNIKTNYKRKSLDSENTSKKIFKINLCNSTESENKENEMKTDFNTPADKGVVNNSHQNNDIYALQLRNDVSQVFENLERSICHLGPNQDPLQQSISEKVIGNIEWPEDTFVTDALLNGLTQSTNGNSVGNWLKKALKENASKAVKPQNLVNNTVINSEPVFQNMGPFYGLPSKVQELVKLYKGIEQLYDWQDECLKLPAVQQKKNLIYSLPTSGGKTLVAEILILQELICRKRNAIFVLPYVAIVQEKVWALSPFAVALDFLVEEYAAGKGTYPPKKRRHKRSVYIATTEKALGLINSLVETGRLEELGLLVIDELHLIGDEQRGPTLETLLTKLMYINDDIQIVGMSATIGNLSDIQKFLNAEVYIRNFRPVELTEYVKCELEVAKINWNADADHILEINRTIDFGYSNELIKIDPDRIGGLVMETVPSGSCLIFCPSKKNCENVTKLLCRVLYRTLKNHKTQEKIMLINALKNDAGTLCSILRESIPYGIAYHHSGLTAEERRLIEESYRTGILCVICCTSTLAAGVNLPAKRVIIRKPYIAQDFISLSRYKQMIGRAGRAGFGEIGESILICERQELKQVKELLTTPMDQTLSKMHNFDCTRLRYLFLSCISLGTANTMAQLEKVANMTLLAVQQEKLKVDIKKLTKKVISDLFILGAVKTFDDSDKNTNTNSTSMSDMSIYLNSSDLVQSKESDSLQSSADKRKRVSISNKTKLIVSKLGKAAIKGNLDLSKAHLLYGDLVKAQESLVLLDCLHLLYLITPYTLVEQIKPDKTRYHDIMMQLGSQERKTAGILNITESCIVRMFTNQTIKEVPERVLNRFYTSLMLYDLWNEVQVIEVSEKYQVNRGIVQNLMTQAATFASNVVSFCEELEEFWAFAHLLRGMSQRLAHCCCRDLVPLMELPAVKQNRAKQLFNAGFKNLQSIARADPNDLIQNIEFMSHRIANQLIAAAKMLLLEKVETLREEAEDVLDGVDHSKLLSNQTFFVK